MAACVDVSESESWRLIIDIPIVSTLYINLLRPPAGDSIGLSVSEKHVFTESRPLSYVTVAGASCSTGRCS